MVPSRQLSSQTDTDSGDERDSEPQRISRAEDVIFDVWESSNDVSPSAAVAKLKEAGASVNYQTYVSSPLHQYHNMLKLDCPTGR